MARKIALGSAALLVLLVGGFLAWSSRSRAEAERRWAAFEPRSEALLAGLRARSRKRPVLRGTATPGNAWTEYEEAFKILAQGGFKPVQDWLEGRTETDPKKVDEALAAAAPALDRIRAGASREEAAYPFKWEEGFQAAQPGIGEATSVVLAVNGQARRLREAGKHREAADLLLDGIQFGGDLGRDLPLTSNALARVVLMKLFDSLRALPPDADVARALAVFDAALPGWDRAMLDDIAMTSAGIRAKGFLDGPGVSAAAAWKHGFSTKLLMVDAWESFAALMPRLAAAAKLPYAEARRAGEAVQEEARALPNPVAREWIRLHSTSHLGGHTMRAQLRLLRRYHGETAPLDDPFGDTIRSDASKAWSVGADGVDDGGKGAWAPAPQGDLVIELRK